MPLLFTLMFVIGTFAMTDASGSLVKFVTGKFAMSDASGSCYVKDRDW